MKVCGNCGTEIYGRDGENLCSPCDEAEDSKRKLKRQRAAANKKHRDEMMESLGLTKVKGAMGGTYWE